MTASMVETMEPGGGGCDVVAFRPGLPLDVQVNACLRAIVINALTRAGGNQCTAAAALQVHRNTMLRYCTRLGIDARRFRPGRKKKAPRADVRDVMRRIGARA